MKKFFTTLIVTSISLSAFCPIITGNASASTMSNHHSSIDSMSENHSQTEDMNCGDKAAMGKAAMNCCQQKKDNQEIIVTSLQQYQKEKFESKIGGNLRFALESQLFKFPYKNPFALIKSGMLSSPAHHVVRLE